MAYTFRGLDHYCLDKKYSSIQADMMLEKELRVLLLYLETAEEGCHNGPGMRTYKTSKPAPAVAQFLQQAYTYCNQATPLGSTTPHGTSIETHESMETTFILITTLSLTEVLIGGVFQEQFGEYKLFLSEYLLNF